MKHQGGVMKSYLSSLFFMLLLCSCGNPPAQEDASDRRESRDERPHTPVFSETLTEDLKQSAFHLIPEKKGSDPVYALFYLDKEEEAQLIPAAEDKRSFYPSSANRIVLYASSGKNLEKVRIFSCCGMMMSSQIRQNTDGVWEIHGFSVNADSKAPMTFTLDGNDYYLRSDLKQGLSAMRKGLSTLIRDSEMEYGLSQQQRDRLEHDLDQLLRTSLGKGFIL